MPEETQEQRERPQTSRRDYGELRDALERWVREQLAAEEPMEVSALAVPASNGMSSVTVLFDLVAAGGTSPPRACVARLAPEDTAMPVFPVYDLGRQFRVMRLVAERTDVPVPTTLWYEPSSAALGSPFFVMERIDGVVPPDVMPYTFGDNWLHDATRTEQRQLQNASVAVLAELHGIDGRSPELDFLQLERPEPTALRRHVAEQWGYYEWVVGEHRHPVLERCFSWLDDHWPSDAEAASLSWGDARIGNVLYRDFTPVAVLDWEMAGVAPREVDLGWMIYLHRFFDDLASELGVPGMPHFLRPDDVATVYERESGHTPRDLEFYTMYAALRHGIVMSRVQQRSVHFGEIEMPADRDDLVMHRATLERMLAGEYWPGLA